jgi:hypothetical protein
MAIRDLITWIRSRDVAVSRGAQVDNATVYIVKWIPKDQDVVIDHCTRYGTPSPAMQFAVNALQLSPKKIWIEDGEGVIHADHETILVNRHVSASDDPAVIFSTGTGEHGARPTNAVDNARLEESMLTSPDSLNVDRARKGHDGVVPSEVNLLFYEPTDIQHVEGDQVRTKQNDQEQINILLAEIQCLLTEPLPRRTQHDTAAVIRSEIVDFDATRTVEINSVNSPNDVRRKQNERDLSGPIRQEVEALLGISAEGVLTKN